MSVVIADELTALCRAPESSSRRSRSSTVFIGRLRGGLGTLSLLRRRRLALHLFLGILRRRCDVSGCTIHRAGRRMLINFSAGSRRLSGITRSGSGTCILCARGLAHGVARAGLRGGSTQNQDSAACEKESFRVHLLLLGFRRWNGVLPRLIQHRRETDPCAASSVPGKLNLDIVLSSAFCSLQAASMQTIARALFLILPASARDRAPAGDPRTPNAAIQPSSLPEVLTGREQLGKKRMDEQRIDNCKVPIDNAAPSGRRAPAPGSDR